MVKTMVEKFDGKKFDEDKVNDSYYFGHHC